MREQLMGALTGQFDREVERSAQQVQEAVGPYTRFVRAERERLDIHPRRAAADPHRARAAAGRDRLDVGWRTAGGQAAALPAPRRRRRARPAGVQELRVEPAAPSNAATASA